MPLSSLNISLPAPLKAYVEAQIEAGDYGTPSEYVRDLIREDKERRLSRLEEHLVEAMKGEPIAISEQELERGDLIATLERKLKERHLELPG